MCVCDETSIRVTVSHHETAVMLFCVFIHILIWRDIAYKLM